MAATAAAAAASSHGGAAPAPAALPQPSWPTRPPSPSFFSGQKAGVGTTASANAANAAIGGASSTRSQNQARPRPSSSRTDQMSRMNGTSAAAMPKMRNSQSTIQAPSLPSMLRGTASTAMFALGSALL